MCRHASTDDRQATNVLILLTKAAAEQGVAAERLDQGGFGSQKRQNCCSDLYQYCSFQPPTERQTEGHVNRLKIIKRSMFGRQHQPVTESRRV